MSLTKDGFDNIEGQVFEVIRGVEGDCLTLGDEDGGTRISGPKPWGGGQVVKTFATREKYGPIEHLEAENAKLQEQVTQLRDDWESERDYADQMEAKEKRAVSENTKLRKLVCGLNWCTENAKEPIAECEHCPLGDTDDDELSCEKLMRELGMIND